MAPRRDARRLDGGLQIHAEDRGVQEDLEHGLLLDVATGRAERHEKPAVGERHRRRRSQARPLARRDHARMLRVQPALRPARRHDAADPGDDGRIDVRIARCGREAVARFIDDPDVARVERVGLLSGEPV